MAEAEERGWKPRIRLVEVVCRGFVGKSVLSLLTELGIRVQSLKQAVNNVADTVAGSSDLLWMRRKVSE